jgi:Autotransporter beta-domain
LWYNFSKKVQNRGYDMRAKIVVALISLAGVAMSSAALAQSNTPVTSCAALDGVNEPPETDVTACAKLLTNRQSLFNTSASIRNIILERFDLGPSQTEPAGLELSDPNDILQRLSGNGDIAIAPTADVAAAEAKPMWNVWTDGKYSWLDDTSAVSNLDGSLVNLVVGADYKVGDRLVLGVMGTYENSDLKGDGVLPPTQKVDGWGGGVYMGLTLTDNLVFSANVLGTSLDTDVNGATNFDSTRIQTSEALTGYWYSGTWRFSPSLTVAWTKEWQDASAGLNAQTIETAVVSPAVQIGDSVSIGGANTVEPWVGAGLDWAVRNRVKDKVLGTILNDPNTDLRLQSGLNFAFGANAQLALTAEVSGLLLNDSDTYTAGANFAYQF